MTLFEPDEPRQPAGPVVKLAAVVAYEGSGFRGFAAQPGGIKTVAGAITAALERTLGHEVQLTCAGRTDAGVHARAQVISFTAQADRVDVERLHRSLNKQLGPSIVVRSLRPTSPDFDARFSAQARTYRYRILNSVVPDPFLDTTAWWVPQPLELRRLRLACDPFLGEHDFSSFCRKPKGRADEPLPRRILEARWEVVDHDPDEDHRILDFWISANAFCHQMVRSVVGTIVDVGLGRLTAGDLLGIIRAADRDAAGTVAPPQGLCLWKVHYPDGLP